MDHRESNGHVTDDAPWKVKVVTQICLEPNAPISRKRLEIHTWWQWSTCKKCLPGMTSHYPEGQGRDPKMFCAQYNNNKIIIIPRQCLWCMLKALREFTMVHAVSAARRQVAADLWTKPIGLNHKPACRLPVNYTTLTIAILLLLSRKADTHFTIPRKVEGWVDLVGWLHTDMVYPLAHGYPSKYWPGPA